MSISIQGSGNENLKPKQTSTQANKSGYKGVEKNIFTEKIQNQLNRSGLNKTQISQYMTEATSIFDQADNNPHDGKLDQAEAGQVSAKLADFYNKVNSAINGVTSADEINQEREKFNAKFVNASPQEQKAILDKEKSDFEAKGYKVQTSVDGTWNITEPGGNTFTINIYDNMGLDKDTALKIIQGQDELQTIEDSYNEEAKPLNKISTYRQLDILQAQGYDLQKEETTFENGKRIQVATFVNANGETKQIKMDYETNAIIQ